VSGQSKGSPNARTLAALASLAIVTIALVVALNASVGAARSAHAASSHRPAADCQPFSARPCLLPFPNNLFTVRDRSTPTGLRVHLPANAMPITSHRQRISVREYDRNDGFSPGSAMIVHVPGLDNATAFARTDPVGLLDMKQAFARNQPIVVIDEATGRRQLIYAELDANAPSPADTNLLIVPGKALTEGHTYVVALRNLRNAAGHLIHAPAWFEKLRDDRALPRRERGQRGRYARIFKALGRARIGRHNLYEAWDFTVGSEKSLTSRLLSIRNRAFAQLGDHNLADGRVQGSVPRYTIKQTTLVTPQLRDIQGTFRVPCFLVACGESAKAAFHYSSSRLDALPSQIKGRVATAQFECIIPTSAAPLHPARIALFGHGLLGSHAELQDPPAEELATNFNIVLCGTNWWGLATNDAPLALAAAANLNLFPAIVDRLQQGVLNALYLARLMLNPRGFAANPQFQAAGKPIIDTSHLFYDGNSQGGIEGGLLTAVSPDVRRAVLGVTGLDYGNQLIQRSTDFTPFKVVLEFNYRDQSMYPVITDLLQQLWDRGDPEGYAPQMTAHPLPDTPSHSVLMQIAYGDFQVSMYGGAAEARTIGASAYEPALDPARSRDRNLFYGIPAIKSFPFRGSAIEIWDSGPGRVQPPPLGNVPPTAGPNNIDPHSDPRLTPAAQSQISAFLEPNGAVINACGGSPCHSYDYTP